MRKLLFLALLLPLVAVGQEKTSPDYEKILNQSGHHILKFQSEYLTGVGISLSGAVVTVAIPAIAAHGNYIYSSAYLIPGFVITGTGFITSLASFRHLKAAGDIMRQRKMAKKGIPEESDFFKGH